MNTLMKTLKENIHRLEELEETYAWRKGYVVESENHVNVGMGHGLNGTEFTVKTAGSCRMAQVFDTRETAEKYGCDYCLTDGYGEPVTMRITPAVEFFAREAALARKLLLFVQGTQEGGQA